MSFSKKLSKLRKEKGFTQEDMAKRIGVGIAQVRRYEKGASSPTLEVIKNIAQALGTSTDELIFEKKERIASVKILDRNLLEQFEMVSKLPPHEIDAVKTILDGVIIKNRIEEIVPRRSDEAWTKEMRQVVAELRKGAQEYSEEEIDDIVDDAVAAVRRNAKQESKKIAA